MGERDGRERGEVEGEGEGEGETGGACDGSATDPCTAVTVDHTSAYMSPFPPCPRFTHPVGLGFLAFVLLLPTGRKGSVYGFDADEEDDVSAAGSIRGNSKAAAQQHG